MIEIRPSPTADTRTCDYATVTQETLRASSEQHIGDVRRALTFFIERLAAARMVHDWDKVDPEHLQRFHADFVTGFAQTGWWDNHRKVNRHHLAAPDGVPADVNLIDVLDFIADCVCAGMARSGTVTPITLPLEVLVQAFQNTIALLQANVVLVSDAEAVQS
jgi:hypothetical protein